MISVLLFGAAQLHAENLSFVTCPIVRDTKTVPCWLAEYKGETYYLGNQGGVAQDFYPPQLNHEVLVEGVVVEGQLLSDMALYAGDFKGQGIIQEKTRHNVGPIGPVGRKDDAGIGMFLFVFLDQGKQLKTTILHAAHAIV